MDTLTQISDLALESSLKSFVGKERAALVEVLRYLSEFAERKLYSERGYSSLFTYCTKVLKYSDSAAHRRTKAVEALRKDPGLYEKIRNGEISLAAVVELEKVLTPENAQELVKEVAGRPKVEVQKIVARLSPPSMPIKERVTVRHVVAKPVEATPLFEAKEVTKEPTEIRYMVTLDADEELMELLNKTQQVTGQARRAEALKKALKEYLKRNDPKARIERRQERQVKKSDSQSRYIAQPVRDRVFVRDQGQCTFRSRDGVRCCETKYLQYDHIQPFALGGSNEPENLRLLCSAHNQLEAIRAFGPHQVKSYFHVEVS